MISGHNWRALPESEEEVVRMLNAAGASGTHMGNVNAMELIGIVCQLASVYNDIEKYLLEALDYFTFTANKDDNMSVDWGSRVRSALTHTTTLVHPNGYIDNSVLRHTPDDEYEAVELVNQFGIECEDLDESCCWGMASLIQKLAIVYLDIEAYSMEAIGYFEDYPDEHPEMSGDWTARTRSALMHASFLLQPVSGSTC